MSRWLAVVALVALMVAACVAAPGSRTTGPGGSASMSPASSATLGTPVPTSVPWSAAMAPPSPAPTPSSWPTGPACGADQLAATWFVADQTFPGGYSIWNTGTTPCSIGRAVSVSILDATGHKLDVSTSILPLGPMCGGTGGQCPPPGPTAPPRIFMPPSATNAQNGGAGASITWTNWCAGPPTGPLTLEITVGSNTVIRTQSVTPRIPGCPNASKPSVLDVTPFEIGGDWPTEPPAIPADDLTAALDVPVSATRGQPLHYVVVLTNPTSLAITLAPCPTYQERLNATGGPVVEERILNCSGVGAIGPGQSVPFAMVIQVPASMPPSTDGALVWLLDPNYSLGFVPPLGAPHAKVPVTVVAP